MLSFQAALLQSKNSKQDFSENVQDPQIGSSSGDVKRIRKINFDCEERSSEVIVEIISIYIMILVILLIKLDFDDICNNKYTCIINDNYHPNVILKTR